MIKIYGNASYYALLVYSFRRVYLRLIHHHIGSSNWFFMEKGYRKLLFWLVVFILLGTLFKVYFMVAGQAFIVILLWGKWGALRAKYLRDKTEPSVPPVPEILPPF
ncbi:MAG: hypothetical protein LBO66_00550 [Deltaproteobacteria bacterium]|nr:hypothetical protein [Deltaproteobacteria bacterium]